MPKPPERSEDFGLDDADLPAFFYAADGASLKGQQRFIGQNRLQLMLLIAAALLGVLAQALWEPAGWVAGALLVVASLLRLYMGNARDDRLWYEGRAAAESTKTLAWRYAAGGRPFATSLDESDARELFIRQLGAVAETVNHLPIVPAVDAHMEITQRMGALRRAVLARRIEVYAKGRIQNQREWYATKAAQNEAAARSWQRTVVGFEILGALTAFALAAGLFKLDLVGIASAGAAAAVAWTGLRQHNALTTAYSVAAQELGRIMTLIPDTASETSWADFVDQSEEAISREHTLWVASRGVLRMG